MTLDDAKAKCLKSYSVFAEREEVLCEKMFSALTALIMLEFSPSATRQNKGEKQVLLIRLKEQNLFSMLPLMNLININIAICLSTRMFKSQLPSLMLSE